MAARVKSADTPAPQAARKLPSKPKVGPPPRVFFTIVANNYLAYARTLMESLRRHHPESPLYVVLCDEPHPGETVEGAQLLPAHALDLPDFDAMAFFYDVMEFATAIKPACFQHLFARHRRADIIYLDPDILVTAPLLGVEAALDEGASLVLTPHITAPLQDGAQPDDLTIMKSGAYNCGFFAARADGEARGFIAWWHERCRRDAVVDIPGNRFTDQRWVDLAPSFCPHARILHDPAYNLAYWNLGQRRVARRGSTTLVDGAPLRFVHFSGVTPADRTVFSKHQTRFAPADLGALRPLFEAYLDHLHAHGWAATRGIPYAYGKFRSGRAIMPAMRFVFRRHEAEIADPFGENGAVFDSIEPAFASHGPPGLTRTLHALWHSRPDLRRQFDIERPDGRMRLLQWFVEEGERSEGFDTRSVAAAATILGRREAVGGFNPWPPQAVLVHDGPRGSLDAWLAEPVTLNPPLAGSPTPLPRHLALVWESRADLRQHFIIRGEAELSAYLAWCLTFGMKEGVIDAALIESSMAPFADEVLDAPEGGGPPVTRMMEMLAGTYAGPFPDAAREYKASFAGRAAILLWTLAVAGTEFEWPRGFLHTLLAWCHARAPQFADQGPPITNLLLMIWTLRTDVRGQCDLRTLEGQMRLIAWTIGFGMRELRLPLDAVSDELFAFLGDQHDPDVPAFCRFHALIWNTIPRVRLAVESGTVAGKRGLVRLAAASREDEWDFACWLDRIAPPPPHASAIPPGGVLITGLVGKASGRGEDARLTAAALASLGVDTMTLDRLTGEFAGAERRPAAVDIVHHNADSAAGDYVFSHRTGTSGAYRIGYWAWELARFPAAWRSAFAYYDEIWTSTRFSYDAIREAAPKPVFLMPMPVVRPPTDPSLTRASFGLPDRKFLFFFGFDFGSFLARKNPQAVLTAFRTAFPRGDDGVGLVVKTLGGAGHEEGLAALMALAKADPRIIVRDHEYNAVEHATLIACCDCYVSLHRSEGFGRGPAEAMAAGKPVIATGYSGNLDYMTAQNALLVDYRLVPVRAGQYPGWEGQSWAEPDVEQAAFHMRRVRDNAAIARRLGRAAAATIAERYDPAAIGRAYLARLRALPVALALPSRARRAAPRPARASSA